MATALALTVVIAAFPFPEIPRPSGALFAILLAVAALGVYLALSERAASLFMRAAAAAGGAMPGGARPPVWHPDGVRELLDEAGYHRVTPLAFYGACAAGAVLGALVGNLLASGVAVVMAAGAVGGFMIPFYLVTRQAEAVASRRRGQFAEAVEVLRGLMRSGYGLEGSIAFLAEKGPKLMQPVMQEALVALRTGGMYKAAEVLRRRVASYDGDRLALALAAAVAYGGGSVGAVIEEVARAVRDDLLVRREAEAEMARQELAARIIGGMPIVILAAMFRFSPEYAAVYREPLGQGVLAVMFALIVLGYVLMRRGMQLPREGRLQVNPALIGEARA